MFKTYILIWKNTVLVAGTYEGRVRLRKRRSLLNSFEICKQYNQRINQMI